MSTVLPPISNEESGSGKEEENEDEDEHPRKHPKKENDPSDKESKVILP